MSYNVLKLMQVQKAKVLHPDAHLNESHADKRAWLAVLLAYQTLRNPKARLIYDASIQSQERNDVVQAEGREMSLTTELGNELHAALQTAYFGPPLPSRLAPGQFPDCFEADERSTISGTGDILHLLFGRQLLGVVRLRDQRALGDDRLMSRNEEQPLHWIPHNNASQIGLPADQSKSRQNQKDEVLDLLLNNCEDNDCKKVMATAVRTWIEDKDKNKIKRRVIIYKNDTVLATLDDEGPMKSTRVARIQAGLSSAGFSHTVLRNSAPLIHHLAIITKTNLCVAKARRPWLPPSTFWLFKPRTHTHAIGGWIVDWPGHQQENRPGWICPEIIVFIIALDTLDREGSARLGTDNLKRVDSSLGLDKEKNGEKTVWQRWKGRVESMMFNTVDGKCMRSAIGRYLGTSYCL
jgi:curved DNA-binding protein CbpA